MKPKILAKTPKTVLETPKVAVSTKSFKPDTLKDQLRSLSRRVVKKPPDVVIKKKPITLKRVEVNQFKRPRLSESLLPPLLDIKKPTESLHIINERPRYMTRGHFKEDNPHHLRLSSPSLTKSNEGPPLTKKYRTFREHRKKQRDSSNDSAHKESTLPSLFMDLSKDSVSVASPPVIAEKVHTVRRKHRAKHASVRHGVNDSLVRKSQKFREALLTKIYFPNP